MLGGPGILDKNGAIRCILSVPKYFSINLKIINQQQQNLFVMFFFNINPDVRVSMKINTFM